MSSLFRFTPLFSIFQSSFSTLYSCQNNDLHSPQILGDSSGLTVFNHVSGLFQDDDLTLCGKTSSSAIIGGGVEQISCGGSISGQSTVPFIVITGTQGDMQGLTNVEALVGFSAMNLDNAAEGQPAEYAICSAANNDEEVYFAVTENPIQIHSLTPFDPEDDLVYYFLDSSGNLLDSTYEVVGVASEFVDDWVVIIKGPVEITAVSSENGNLKVKTILTTAGLTFYGGWVNWEELFFNYDDGTNFYFASINTEGCKNNKKPNARVFSLSSIVAGDTLVAHTAKFTVGVEASNGAAGMYYRNSGHNYLQRNVYEDGNTYRILCVTEGDDDDKANGYLAYDDTNSMFLLVSIIHKGGNDYVNRYKRFYDISAYNFGTDFKFKQYRRHAVAGFFNTNTFGDINYGGQVVGLVIFDALENSDCSPFPFSKSDGANSKLEYTDDLDGGSLSQVEYDCASDDSPEIFMHAVTAFCLDSYAKETFVRYSCSESLVKQAADPFSSLSFVTGEAPSTVTLTNYQLGCDAGVTDLTLSFADASSNDMVATYAWFSTSANTFTIDPTHASFTAGTWTVTVTASYYMTHNSATITESTFSFDLETLASGNSAPILTAHDCNAASVTVGSTITCTFTTYSDPEGDQMVLSIHSGESWVSESSDVFTFSPNDNSQVGANDIELRITDDNSTGESNGIQFTALIVTITVLPLNSAPSIDSTDCANSSVYVGQTYSCSITKSDPEAGDNIAYSFNPATAWTSESSNTISFSPTFNSQAGAHTIEIIITDDNSLSAANGVLTDSVTIVITVLEINTAPAIKTTDCSTSSIDVGQTYTCSISAFTDAQSGDAHDYRVEDDFDADFMTLVGNTLTVSPISNNDADTYNLDFYVRDDNSLGTYNGRLEDVVTFTLTINQANSVPRITNHNCDEPIYVGLLSSEDCKLQNYKDDDNGDVLTISLPDGLSWVRVEAADDRIYFEPDNASQQGQHTIEIRVTDDNSLGGSNGVQHTSIFVTVNVLADNSAPYFTSNTCVDHEMQLGEQFQCQSTFEDPNPGDKLSFNVKPGRYDWAFHTDDGLVTLIPDEVGEFKLRVQVKDNNSINGKSGNLKDEIYFTIKVFIENTAPEFTTSVANQEIKVQESVIVGFPSVLDSEQDGDFSYLVEVNGGGAPSFMEIGDSSISVTPTEDSQAGTYEIIIIVKDTPPDGCDCDSFTDQLSFEVEILVSDGKKIVDEATYLVQNLYPFEINIVPTPEGQDPPSWRLETVSNKGLLTIIFSQKMYGIPDVGNIVDNNVIEVEILHDFELYKPEEMLISFQAVKMERNQLQIQLNFKDPVLITTFSDPDRVRAKMLRPNIFVSKDTDQLLGGEMIKTARIVPQAVEGGAAVVAKGIGDFMSSSGQVTAGVNFASKFILSSTLNLLWSLMNTMQIIVHFPMTAVQFPSNAISFSSIFLQLCQFDVLPHWFITDAAFKFLDDNEPLYLHYFNASFETNNFMLNAGSALWFVVIYFILAAFTLIVLKLTKTGRFYRMGKYLQGSLFFPFIIRLLIEGYIDYLLSILLQLQASTKEFYQLDLSNYESGDYFAIYAATAMSTLVIGFSVFAVYATTCGYKRIFKGKTKEKYEELIVGFDDTRVIARLFIVFFLLRRLIFAVIVIFRPDDAGFQIITINYTSFIILIYLLDFKPLTIKALNFVELANESTILLLSYFLLCFSDFNPDPVMRMNFGYLYCTLFTCIMALNFVYIFKGVGAKLINKCKKKKNQAGDLKAQDIKIEEAQSKRALIDNQGDKNSSSDEPDIKNDQNSLLVPAQKRKNFGMIRPYSLGKVAQLPQLQEQDSVVSMMPGEQTVRVTRHRRVMKPKKKKKKKNLSFRQMKEINA